MKKTTKKPKKMPKVLKRMMRGPQGFKEGRYNAKWDDEKGWQVAPLIGGEYTDVAKLQRAKAMGELLGRKKAYDEVVQELKVHLGHSAVYGSVSQAELVTFVRSLVERSTTVWNEYNDRDR